VENEYKNSLLWKSAFNKTHARSASERKKIERLLSSLDELDGFIADILLRIPTDCKGLTLHDIEHCHQLWDVASVICGDKYPINPSEGFVLGAAFLIHDAGLTAAVYPGGVHALKRTSIYLDMVASFFKQVNPKRITTIAASGDVSSDIADRALFNTLRILHADRAEHLVEDEYIDPLLGTSFTLLRPGINLDFGSLIGKIAASHHWDIKTVDSTFSAPESPSTSYPNWTIDAFKLACILRAADACAIDERRARIMPFILENPRGISRDHWLFQRNLRPAYRQRNSDEIVFKSKRAVPRDQMSSWWIGFDAIGIADGELRACDRLLKRRAGIRDHHDGIQFAAKRVEGSGDPSLLSQLIEVSGWRPVDTLARIDNPAAIIELLGGQGLYGNDHSAPFRELLQNAADAIHVKRLRAGYGPNAERRGEILVSVERMQPLPDQWRLTVCDDGLGMDEEGLTSELLVFGNSLWSSARLPQLYPGLAANPKFKPIGRFGIGFYSAFLLGDNVKVMSKRYTAGESSRHVLHFLNGLKGRAELRKYDSTIDGEWSHDKNTIVRIEPFDMKKLQQFVLQAISAELPSAVVPGAEDPQFWGLLTNALNRLTFCLDVAVALEGPDRQKTVVNDIDVLKLEKRAFCQEFNRVFGRTGGPSRQHVQKMDERNYRFVEFIGGQEDNSSRGSCSNTTMLSAGVFHIGGLTVCGVSPAGIDGIVEAVPQSANRAQIVYGPTPSAFRDWAALQLSMLSKERVKEDDLGQMLVNICDQRVELGKYSFLTDFFGKIVYIDDINISDGDEIFLGITHHYSGVALAPLRANMSSLIGNHLSTSAKFRYVLGSNYGSMSSLYNQVLINKANEDLKSNQFTAFQRLLQGVEAKGLEVRKMDVGDYEVGIYTGPNGGTGPLRDPKLKKGSSISRHGIRMKFSLIGNAASRCPNSEAPLT
jgi:Histidine kinase-, DNA gyrase B-, and HSP90-like ATPase